MDGRIALYSGGTIDPINPDPDDIRIEDIAHALSNTCRFTGHVREFYSVAQHSVSVSFYASGQDAMWGLLHDASEAYLADLARPVKHGLGLGDVYRSVEGRLMAAVCVRFNLPPEMPESVRYADELLLANEIDQLMPASSLFADWPDFNRIPRIESAAPGEAEQRFLDRYDYLRKEYYGPGDDLLAGR